MPNARLVGRLYNFPTLCAPWQARESGASESERSGDDLRPTQSNSSHGNSLLPLPVPLRLARSTGWSSLWCGHRRRSRAGALLLRRSRRRPNWECNATGGQEGGTPKSAVAGESRNVRQCETSPGGCQTSQSPNSSPSLHLLTSPYPRLKDGPAQRNPPQLKRGEDRHSPERGTWISGDKLTIPLRRRTASSP